KHYILPDNVPPPVGSVTFGVGPDGTQNYLTSTSAATITGELRFDGTQYKFVSDQTVNSILNVTSVMGVSYNLNVQGNDSRLSGAQPVTNSSGQIELTLPPSAPVSWTSDEDSVLSDPVTGRLRS